MRVFILGGGPCGLAIADDLNARNIEFTLVERESTLGGLAKTITWDSHGDHDLGPHKIFTQNEKLMNRVKNLLPASAWIEQKKSSRIYLNQTLLNYPPPITALLKVYGPFIFMKMVVNYATAKLRSLIPTATPKTFEDDLRARVGTALYENLFAPIAKKLWKDPKELDSKLSRSRVQTPSLLEVIKNTLGLRKKSEFEALTFLYPKGGLQRLWDSILKRSSKNGLFLTDHEVHQVHLENNKIKSMVLKNTKNGTEKNIDLASDDFVVSTMPVPALLSKIKNKTFSNEVQKALSFIQANDLLLVFLKLKTKRLMKDSWIFVPDVTIPFHRISEQHAFDEGMVSEGTILCCEMMSRNDQRWIEQSDEALIEAVLKGLESMGFREVRELLVAGKVTRLPKSYPVYVAGYEPQLSRILSEIDQIDNLHTVGRQGAFNYIGTLDAMDIGYGFAEWLAKRNEITKNESTVSWQKERERTNLYPVLD